MLDVATLDGLFLVTGALAAVAGVGALCLAHAAGEVPGFKPAALIGFGLSCIGGGLLLVSAVLGLLPIEVGAVASLAFIAIVAGLFIVRSRLPKGAA